MEQRTPGSELRPLLLNQVRRNLSSEGRQGSKLRPQLLNKGRRALSSVINDWTKDAVSSIIHNWTKDAGLQAPSSIIEQRTPFSELRPQWLNKGRRALIFEGRKGSKLRPQLLNKGRRALSSVLNDWSKDALLLASKDARVPSSVLNNYTKDSGLQAPSLIIKQRTLCSEPCPQLLNQGRRATSSVLGFKLHV